MTADLSNFHIAMICIAYRMGWAMDGKLGPKPHLTPTKVISCLFIREHKMKGLSLSAYRLFVLRKLGQTAYTCNPGTCPYLGISADGEKEEFVNEARTIEDLGLFIPMLKLVERQVLSTLGRNGMCWPHIFPSYTTCSCCGFSCANTLSIL